MNTDNELIAEFMGGDPQFNQYSGYYFVNYLHNGANFCKTEDLAYHKSWDWLMPVVEKINNETDFKFSLLTYPTIKEAHVAVVEFIKWYNSQKA